MLDVGNSKDSWLRPTLEYNVHQGCHKLTVDACSPNPCPDNSDCLAQGVSNFVCECHPGYVGKRCTPMCELNPCSLGSTCVPANNTHGYRCLCDHLHSGFYCEDRLPEQCPSDWWGYPICGPCNCDVARGYDGNCNQTNGQCSCTANRYQPEASDVCFDCDCYMTGSYTSRCDRDSGQCQCRPGVIGRRCDHCASPFAEVTPRGCEVIYDACPRAFAEGVWWDRTSFGMIATHHCPVGSSGKAKRVCSKEGDGWKRPDLHGCLSDVFLDLNEQAKMVKVGGDGSDPVESVDDAKALQFTTQHSIKLMQDLR